MDRCTLHAGDLVLEILPGLGGAITRFTAGEFAVFRETPDATASVSDCASFPLIPFSNRIRAGRFSFGDTDIQIPIDRRDPRFTNHGHTRHLPWEVTASTGSDLTLRFTQAEPTDAWPFPFTAKQQFTLTPTGLTMRAWLRNDHTGPAPAGIGFHPYFTRLPDTELGFFADRIWQPDAIDIPVRSETPAGRFDFSTARPLEEKLINHAYGGWNQYAEIIHPGRFDITITGHGAFDHLILFTPEGKDFFGFEPVSHRPDGVNPLFDPQDCGIAILPPGALLEGSCDFAII